MLTRQELQREAISILLTDHRLIVNWGDVDDLLRMLELHFGQFRASTGSSGNKTPIC